ncbi:PTS sugar transporter subunit IIB [Thalassobacillus sp. CUG 92003]|uniref:PTS sugar transporter subunit IIB n=1 Tax=Thalassobacillus sp. CUG 92003 TaxID=2736641 RepID=UPI0015E6B69F
MKVLTVCGLGQGTSLILKMNVETALNEKNIKADVEHMDVSAASSTPADYVVTSSELADSLKDHSGKVVIVKNYFDMEEINQAVEENFTSS